MVFGLALGSLALAAPASAAPATGCAAPTPAALQEFFGAQAPVAPAGVAVSVVSGDQAVFERGYGALDPHRSLLRIASITKLFTWTAVMQQVEAGRLDLNADVNDYLTAFKVPATYPEPITLLTLMNHTSGFEDRIIGTAARTAAGVPPLGIFLAANMPARIRPPGRIGAYSNYGAALAGYIVAQVSGEPWDQYVQQHLLDPLGMTHSTATEPVPAALAGDLAASYDTDETPPRRVPFEFDPLTPDGAISATASDLARFMIAQLNDGRGILTPATTALMHERSYAADPRLGGYAHGFMDRTVNGHRILLHDGGWEAFGSVLILIPDCRLGLFLSSNTTGGTEDLAARLPAFYDRFLPVVAAAAVPAATATPVPGFYRPTRHNESTLEKLVTLLGPARLTVGGDGTVHFQGREWAPQGAGLYQADDDHLVARDGYLATDGPAYQLMSPAQTLPVNLVVLLGVVLLGLSGVAILFRRRQRFTAWRAARLFAATAAVLAVLFIALLLVLLLGDTSAYLYGVPLSFSLLLVLPVLTLPAAVAALTATALGWRRSGVGVLVRTHQIALLTALAGFTWFVWQWNLIGWQYG